MRNERKFQPTAKVAALFAATAFACLALAWLSIAMLERLSAENSSDSLELFLVIVTLGLVMVLCRVGAGIFLGGAFYLALLALVYGVCVAVNFFRMKEGDERAATGKTALAFCIASMVIAVAVIALGIWLAVR